MLRRDPIKYVRDKAKSRYLKDVECYICGSRENLDYHHYNSLTPLFNKWLLANKLNKNTEEDVLAIRDRFIEEYSFEVYTDAVTLCHEHHLQLHSIYGKDPALATAPKQKRWVGIQRDKHGNNRVDG